MRTEPEIFPEALNILDPRRLKARPRTDRKAPAAQLTAVDGLALFDAKYADPEPVIDGLLFRGVTVFAGRPKVGKSWFALELARDVALGVSFLQRLPVKKPGRVVYLALEEPQSRTGSRLRKLVSTTDPKLSNLHFIYRVKPLLAGGAAELDAYLAANPAEVVVIDTLLAIVRASSGRDVVRSDYAEMNVLRQLAEKHHTAILVVCHLRKASAENSLDAVMGTSGVTAGCDAVWTLKRMAGGDFLLEVTGREMEDKTYGLRFVDGKPFGWQITGEGPEAALTEERQEIVELLRVEAPLSPAKIALLLRKNANSIRFLLYKLCQDGIVTRGTDRMYRVSSLIPTNAANERERT